MRIICEYCEQVTDEALTCLQTILTLRNILSANPSLPYNRIPIENEEWRKKMKDYADGKGALPVAERCEDCNVELRPGAFHHIGCPQDVCPLCSKLFLNCSCIALELEEGAISFRNSHRVMLKRGDDEC
jgi:hypothetical protein